MRQACVAFTVAWFLMSANEHPWAGPVGITALVCGYVAHKDGRASRLARDEADYDALVEKFGP